MVELWVNWEAEEILDAQDYQELLEERLEELTTSEELLFEYLDARYSICEVFHFDEIDKEEIDQDFQDSMKKELSRVMEDEGWISIKIEL